MGESMCCATAWLCPLCNALAFGFKDTSMLRVCMRARAPENTAAESKYDLTLCGIRIHANVLLRADIGSSRAVG